MQTAEKIATPYCIKVDPFMIDKIWSKCKPFLENPEIGDVEYTSTEEMKELCKSEEYQLWILMEDEKLTGCFLTNIGEVASGVKMVNLFCLSGGGLKVWIDELDEKVTKFARQNGCIGYSCVARTGFSKFVPELKKLGDFFFRDARQ